MVYCLELAPKESGHACTLSQTVSLTETGENSTAALICDVQRMQVAPIYTYNELLIPVLSGQNQPRHLR